MSKAKFTDRFFVFPIKVWNENRYEKEDGDYKADRGWVKGYARLHYDCLQNMCWWEGLNRDTPIDTYLEKGTDVTVIDCPEYGFFYCTLSRKKFEEKLNDFVDEYTILFPDDVEKEEDLVI